MNIKHILRKDGENDIKLRSRIKKERQIADLSKKVERLREQLEDANKVIKKYSDGTIYLFPTWYNGSRLAEAYLKKWGVK